MDKYKINKDDPTPLYFQLKEIIINNIEDGTYSYGDQIPTEKELMEKYDLSRTTIRQAIDLLVADSILEKRRGIGTFVADRNKMNIYDLGELNNYEDSLKKIGLSGSTKLIEQAVVESNDCLNEVFNSKYNKYYRLDRLRFIDSTPSLLVTTYVPFELFPDLLNHDFSKVSLFDTLEAHYNVTISHAHKTFDSVTVTNEDADILGIPNKSPIHLVSTVTYNEFNEPIEFSKSRDRGDISRFKITLEYGK